VPEGVRRTRPRTAQQEREYKQRKTREDIFLNSPDPVGPGAGVEEFYNPADWLIFDVKSDVSRYIIQDKSGTVLGNMTISITIEEDPLLGEIVHLRRHDGLAKTVETDLLLNAATLKPIHNETRSQLEGTPPPDPGAGDLGIATLYDGLKLLQVEYQFDRVQIHHRAGGISVRRTMRQLPFSYESGSVPLLLRQLDFSDPDWPFEVAVCDPAQQKNLPLVVGQPGKEEHLLSAEPADYRCWVLEVKIGEAVETYWVERLSPRRLVKYTDGELTYTLAEYLEP